MGADLPPLQAGWEYEVVRIADEPDEVRTTMEGHFRAGWMCFWRDERTFEGRLDLLFGRPSDEPGTPILRVVQPLAALPE